MIRFRAISLAAASALIGISAFTGCGSDGASLDDPNGNNPGGPIGDGTDPGGGLGEAGPNSGVSDDLKECAKSTAKGQITKVNLVTMFDKSGSMGKHRIGDVDYDNTEERWDPVSTGMASFFVDGRSAGLNASLQYFPQPGDLQCVNWAYQNPAVELLALPNARFKQSLEGTTPNGGTPTRPALQGAIDFAKAQVKARPAEKTVVLLVTDGEPNNCDSSRATVSAVADAAYKGKPSISTYVIGVALADASKQTINAIAAAGGTKAGIFVEVGNPAKTKQDLQNELAKIRGQIMSCSFAIPAPAAGQTLDPATVNVVFTPKGGKPQTLPKNPSCTGGTGWKYDNEAAPKNIQLCPSACQTVQGNGEITIAYGCKTNIILN